MACSTCSRSVGPCANITTYLRNIRVRAVTLYNVIKILEKKKEYQELIEEVDILLRKPNGECPPQDIINTINNYLDDEYSKYL